MRSVAIASALLIALCQVSSAEDQYRGPNTAEEATSAGPLLITPIYHASLMFEWGGLVVHVDPWSRGDYSKLPKADLILITHQHRDHLDLPLISKLLKPETLLIVNGGSSEEIAGHDWGGKAPDYNIMANGDTKNFSGIGIEAVPAYNPKGEGNGYLLTFGDKRVYVAGDTEFIPEMRELGAIDVAFLPCNLPYTMTLEEVAEAVRTVRPKIFYPYHYRGTAVEKLPTMLADLTEVKVRVVDLY